MLRDGSLLPRQVWQKPSSVSVIVPKTVTLFFLGVVAIGIKKIIFNKDLCLE
jgi:hypothetical protein